jgi:hypothetical protein
VRSWNCIPVAESRAEVVVENRSQCICKLEDVETDDSILVDLLTAYQTVFMASIPVRTGPRGSSKTLQLSVQSLRHRDGTVYEAIMFVHLMERCMWGLNNICLLSQVTMSCCCIVI